MQGTGMRVDSLASLPRGMQRKDSLLMLLNQGRYYEPGTIENIIREH